MGLLSLLGLIFLVLIGLWIAGLVVAWGGWVWALLAAAVIILLIALFSGRRVWS